MAITGDEVLAWMAASDPPKGYKAAARHFGLKADQVKYAVRLHKAGQLPAGWAFREASAEAEAPEGGRGVAEGGKAGPAVTPTPGGEGAAEGGRLQDVDGVGIVVPVAPLPPRPQARARARDGADELPPLPPPLPRDTRPQRNAPATPAESRLTEPPRPDEVPRDERLTDDQNIVVHLILCGYLDAEIMPAMGLTRWKLIAWRRDPVFRGALKAALEEMKEIELERGIARGAAAIDELYAIGMNPNTPAKDRNTAILGFLDRVGYAKVETLKIEGAGGDESRMSDEELDKIIAEGGAMVAAEHGARDVALGLRALAEPRGKGQ